MKLSLVAISGLLFALACSAKQEASSVEQVAGIQTCQSSPCLNAQEVKERLGFFPLEPESLPEGYGLYTRGVLEPVKAGSGVSTAPPDFVETTLDTEYRFLESPHVPALSLFETAVRDVSEVHLELQDPACGEVVERGGREVLYGMGEGSLIVGDDVDSWSVCAAPGPTAATAHVVYLSTANIIIEIKAFPEAGITRDMILDLAFSLALDSAEQ